MELVSVSANHLWLLWAGPQGEQWRVASCLALSTTGSPEGASFIATGNLSLFSEQQPNLQVFGGRVDFIHTTNVPILSHRCLVHRHLHLVAFIQEAARRFPNLQRSCGRCPHHMCPESLQQVDGNEFVHLTTSECVSRFTGYLLSKVWTVLKTVVTQEYVGHLVRKGCEQGIRSCFTQTSLLRKLPSSAQFLSHRLKVNVLVYLATCEICGLWTPHTA